MTTSNDPEQIRLEIERTRSDLSRNVNQLGDAVSPGSIAQRQKTKMRRQLSGWKERVMGTSDDLSNSMTGTTGDLRQQAGEAAGQVSDTVQELPHLARTKTQGNPLAAGLIALGAGWLLGSVIPASSKEQEAATALKEQAEPMLHDVADEAKQVGKDMAGHLRGPAQQSMEEVKSQAQSSTEEVRTQAQSSAGDVRDTATDAAQSAQQGSSPST